MTSVDVESVLRKVKALLSKTEDAGCTAEEAGAAAEKARELLDEHNLSMGDITPEEMKSQVEEDIVPLDYDRVPLWVGNLANNIALAFDCKCIKLRANKYSKSKLLFIGFPVDVQTVIHFFAVLQVRFYNEAEKQAKTNARGHRRIYINNFICAAARAVYDRLYALKKREEVRTLIIRKDEAVKAYVESKFNEENGNELEQTYSHAKHDDNGSVDGHHYGKTCDLNLNNIAGK